MSNRYIGLVVLLVSLGLAGCNSCHDGGEGAPWDVDDRTDTSTADVADSDTTASDATDTRDASDADDPGDAADTGDITDTVDVTDADETSDTGDTGDRLLCLADPEANCPIQDPDSFGDCSMPLGVVFDGSKCVPASGCGCTGADCPEFATLDECARTCGRAGQCRSDDMPIVWGTEPLTCGDQNCGDRMTFCVSSDTDPTDRLNQVMPDIGVDCVRDESPCHFRNPPDPADECVDGDWCCTESRAYGFGEPELRQLCGVTLLPGVKQATCFYFE